MESYCDIEIERKHWTVKQCYLKHNQRAPKEMHELAERIAATLKAEWKRRKKRRMFPELEEGRKRLFVGKGAA